MPDNGEFSRDLGYLDKFFDKLEAHAGTLPSEAGQRLRALLSEERARWAEIRQLVGTAPAAAAPETNATQAEPERPYSRAYRLGMQQLAELPRTPAAGPPDMGSSAKPASAIPSGPTVFTVGSLKPRR